MKILVFSENILFRKFFDRNPGYDDRVYEMML